MNRKEIEKFLGLSEDAAFAIYLRHSLPEKEYIEVGVENEDIELLDESLLYKEITIHDDKSKSIYYSIINISDIVFMSNDY